MITYVLESYLQKGSFRDNFIRGVKNRTNFSDSRKIPKFQEW